MTAARSTALEDELWRAIGDPSRARILDALLARRSTTQTALAAELPLTRQAVAKHLATLKRTGPVSSVRAGRETVYSVEAARLVVAARGMSAQAASWTRMLAAIDRRRTSRRGRRGSSTRVPRR